MNPRVRSHPGSGSPPSRSWEKNPSRQPCTRCRSRRRFPPLRPSMPLHRPPSRPTNRSIHPPPVDLPPTEAATPTVAPHPVAEEAPGQTAYWATPAEAANGADSLAWTPPVDLAPGAPRPTPAMAGLWATTPATPGDAFADLPGDPPPARRRNRLAIAGGVAALLAACIAGAVFLPRLLTTGGIPAATFNAPMMVLRAATVGRVASVAVCQRPVRRAVHPAADHPHRPAAGPGGVPVAGPVGGRAGQARRLG